MSKGNFTASGSARIDRIAIGVGGVAIIALIAIGQFRGDGPAEGGDAAATASETSGAGSGAPVRRVSAVGNIPPEPPGVPGEVRRSHASASYQQRFDEPYDNEMQILEAGRQQARAAEAARASDQPVPPGQVLASEGAAGDPATATPPRPDGS
jgi:hypothetical protein